MTAKSGFYAETNFKKVSELGKIPAEWEVVQIGDVLSLEYGSGLPDRERTHGPYPVVGSNGIIGYHSKAIVKGPGIVVGRKGSIGAVSWIDSDFWPIDTTFYVKIETSNIFLKWLFYELVYLNLGRFRLADVVPGLKRELVHSLRMPLPPFSEQQKIAEILSTVDEAIQKTDEVIATSERLKKGLMQELLTKGIGHKEFKDTEIGRIPKDWESAKITNIFDLYKGTTPSTKIKEYWDGNIPFVTPTDITKINDANGIYLETTEKYITEKGLKLNGLKLVPKDSILFTSRATIGYLAINKTEVAINQGIISLIPKRANVDVTFFCYLFQKLKNLFENLAGGSTYKEISMSTFSNVNIAIPPFSEQQKIAEILFAVDRKLEIERNEKAKLERIRQGLIDLLLTGKIRIRVGEIS
jgi:type I restriction enzyme S subunit